MAAGAPGGAALARRPSLAHTPPRPALPRLPPSRSARVAARPSLLPARAARRATVQPKALAGFTEVAQLAEAAAGFIFGVSGVMVAITLIVSGGGRLAGRRRRRGGGSAALRRTDQRLAAAAGASGSMAAVRSLLQLPFCSCRRLSTSASLTSNLRFSHHRMQLRPSA